MTMSESKMNKISDLLMEVERIIADEYGPDRPIYWHSDGKQSVIEIITPIDEPRQGLKLR